MAIKYTKENRRRGQKKSKTAESSSPAAAAATADHQHDGELDFFIDTAGSAVDTTTATSVAAAAAATEKPEKDQAESSKSKRDKKSSKSRKNKEASVDNDDTATDERKQSSKPAESSGSSIQSAHFGAVDEDLRRYVVQAGELIDADNFGDDEERRLFRENVFEEIRRKELALATNHDCSLVLEKLLRGASDVQVRSFWATLSERILSLSLHRYASHVAQTLLGLAGAGIDREVRDGPAEAIVNRGDNDSINGNGNGNADKDGDGEKKTAEKPPTFEQLIISAVNELKPHLSTLIADAYGTHIIRSLLQVLAGRVIETGSTNRRNAPQKSNQNDASNKSASHAVPESFAPLLAELSTALANSMDGNALRASATSTVSGPVIQIVLELLAGHPSLIKADGLLDKLTMGLFGENASESASARTRQRYIDHLARDAAGSRLLEKVFTVLPDSALELLFKAHFQRKMASICKHPNANFVAQRLIENIRSEAQLTAIVDEIAPEFGKYVTEGRAGVVRAVVHAAVKLRACYDAVWKAVCSAFEATNAESINDLAMLICTLNVHRAWAAAAKSNAHFSIPLQQQGVLILQGLTQFPTQYSSQLMSGVAATVPEPVRLSWATNAIGSRVVEALLSVQSATFAQRRRLLLEPLLGNYHKLAVDRFGSRVLESGWTVADLQLREAIAGELAAHHTMVSSSHIGRFVLRTCRVDEFKRDKDAWLTRQKNADRRRHMFKDLTKSFSGASGGGATSSATASTTAATTETAVTAATAVTKSQSDENEEATSKAIKRSADEANRDEDDIDKIFSVLEGSESASSKKPKSKKAKKNKNN